MIEKQYTATFSRFDYDYGNMMEFHDIRYNGELIQDYLLVKFQPQIQYIRSGEEVTFISGDVGRINRAYDFSKNLRRNV